MTNWFQDYIRRWRRAKKHVKRTVLPSDAWADDPSDQLIDEEKLKRFRACFNRLAADEKHLWYLLSWGLTEKWIARYEEVSPDALHHRRRKLLTALRRRLRGRTGRPARR